MTSLTGGEAIVAGCDAHYPVNAPTEHQDVTKGYRLERVKADPDKQPVKDDPYAQFLQ